MSTLLAVGTFHFRRVQTNADLVLPLVAFVAILAFVHLMYRRDAVELRPAWGVLLAAMRAFVFFGLLLLYLDPEWRSQGKPEVQVSRALVLADTSLSMETIDADAPAAGPRAGQVARALGDGGLADKLREKHNVLVWRFDQALTPVANLPKRAGPSEETVPVEENRRWAGMATAVAGAVFVAGIALVWLVVRAGSRVKGALTVAWTAAIAGGVLLIHAPWRGPSGEQGQAAAAPAAEPSAPPETPVDWQQALRPRGRETRLGEALRTLIDDQRGGPVAGIVLFSDGVQNAGPPPESAAAAARQAQIPIYVVGVGSSRALPSLRIALDAPRRVYPRDPYTATATLQARGLSGEPAKVQLYLCDPAKKTEQLLESREVTLLENGKELVVKFDLKPGEPGPRKLSLRITPPKALGEGKPLGQDEDIEFIARKTRVLLFAGGPTREYQFLKGLLYRDKTTTTLDVMLQTAASGVSQEADKLLDAFPATREAMAPYDCVVAIDPNWQALKPEQIDALENWVSEHSGGLILIAGPVFMGQPVGGWVQDPAMGKVRALYPVEFHSRLTLLDREALVAREAAPLAFSPEGSASEFLRLAADAKESEAAWALFPGVYGYFPVRGAKRAATVYARYSNPAAAEGGEQPAYFAGQFYGAGRVFYLGSGEMWRLRAIRSTGAVDKGDDYFAQFYTRLIRHVSQGHLLGGSARGSLSTDKERYVAGETVEIWAQVSGVQLQPLAAESVKVQVTLPEGPSRTVVLRRDPARPGRFTGQFTALAGGRYRLEMPIPDSDQPVTRAIQVQTPTELDNTTRDDKLLGQLAKDSGGRYYDAVAKALGDAAAPGVAGLLKDCSRKLTLTGDRDTQRLEHWMLIALAALCGLLCGEWLIRRLLKLA